MQFMTVLGWSAAVMALAVQAEGAVSLNLSSVQIEKGSSAVMYVTASGGDQVSDFELDVKVTAGAGGKIAPITNIDFEFPGSILSGGSEAAFETDPYFPGYTYTYSPTPLFVAANGLVARITFDTSALNAGDTFSVDLFDDQFPSFFNPVSGPNAVTMVPSTATTLTVVVPEPASIGLLAGSSLLLLRRRQRA